MTRATLPHPKKISLNGTELTYIESGRGSLLVFVHGTLGDYRTWRAQFEEFSRDYHMVAYSRRFHFPAHWSESDGEYSVERHSDDLAALIRHFSDDASHLVCASWGGNVALNLALTQPNLVRSMVLAEPPTLPLLEKDPQKKNLLDHFTINSLAPARDALIRNEWEIGIQCFIDGVMGRGTYERLPSGVKKYFLQNATELKGELLSKNYIPDFSEETLSKINAPTLLLKGDRSPEFFHAIAEILHRSLSSSRLLTVPMASHGIHADNPSVHNKLVADFLREVDPDHSPPFRPHD
ncbi:MAG: alpha/beta hydrolase [Ignavibacteriae bacterium]|nr:alpha/beta hydrolase [Ignavibacteriota bacterium]